MKECIPKSDLINAIENHKCPVVHTINLSLQSREAVEKSLHIMVATGVNPALNKPSTSREIQCKNSYGSYQGR